MYLNRGFFVHLKNKNIRRGNLGMLLPHREWGKYLLAILVGVTAVVCGGDFDYLFPRVWDKSRTGRPDHCG